MCDSNLKCNKVLCIVKSRLFCTSFKRHIFHASRKAIIFDPWPKMFRSPCMNCDQRIHTKIYYYFLFSLHTDTIHHTNFHFILHTHTYKYFLTTFSPVMCTFPSGLARNAVTGPFRGEIFIFYYMKWRNLQHCLAQWRDDTFPRRATFAPISLRHRTRQKKLKKYICNGLMV